MPTNDRLDRAREAYRAYESGDRRVLEELLSDDFTFFSPPDPGIDRATYFERCWPNAATIEAYQFTASWKPATRCSSHTRHARPTGGGSATRRC
jgi:ketosteroid isomerase-like protein